MYELASMFCKKQSGGPCNININTYMFSSNLYVNKQGSMQDAVLQNMHDAVLQHIDKTCCVCINIATCM